MVHPMDYLTTTVPLLEAEYAAGGWDADTLLASVLSLDADFYHQSHTLIHLSRDELQESDCNVEDGGMRKKCPMFQSCALVVHRGTRTV